MSAEYNHHHGRGYSTHPKAVAARARRAANPGAAALESALTATRKLERIRTDPEYRKAHSARNNARLKVRRSSRETWAKFALNAIRARAKKEGIAFNLTAADLEPPEKCPALGAALVYGGRSGEPYAPTVDRLLPRLGYTKGNVRVISRRANSMKNDGTSAELQRVIDWMRSEGL